MQLSAFDFPFDASLIAECPVSPRDRARLLVVPRRRASALRHARVRDLPRLLRPGDVLVLNDTKVVPARLSGVKAPGGGAVDVLLVRPLEESIWEVLLKGRVAVGQRVRFGDAATADILERSRDRTVMRIHARGSVRDLLDTMGEMPLPPYIKRPANVRDRDAYQTVFARAEGAVAAPTAGLHFTESLFADLKRAGVHVVTVTLHVGPGTFRPVTVDTIESHRMHAEWYEMSGESARRVNAARMEGRRIVAVGTTAVRTLESSVDDTGVVRPGRGETRLFITPGFAFRTVDALLTNFHQPRTTLLMLVSAFAGLDALRAAYDEAIKARYRLYSYGDAMLIH